MAQTVSEFTMYTGITIDNNMTSLRACLDFLRLPYLLYHCRLTNSEVFETYVYIIIVIIYVFFLLKSQTLLRP